jgi:hypothetical protein
MYLFAHCQYPEMLEVGIMLQFLVLCYGLLGDGMDDAAAVLLDVNDGPSPLQISGDLNCLKSHDAMHCLAGDVAGQSRVDDTGGAMRRCGQPWRRTSQHSLSGSMILYEGAAADVVGARIRFLLVRGHKSYGIIVGMPGRQIRSVCSELLRWGRGRVVRGGGGKGITDGGGQVVGLALGMGADVMSVELERWLEWQ